MAFNDDSQDAYRKNKKKIAQTMKTLFANGASCVTLLLKRNGYISVACFLLHNIIPEQHSFRNRFDQNVAKNCKFSQMHKEKVRIQ
ncbi:MAG TPA: hypothetical protein VN626_04075 [Clostridia bacterium]|nr:hypothetical protein [Clostridia bacterium]